VERVQEPKPERPEAPPQPPTAQEQTIVAEPKPTKPVVEEPVKDQLLEQAMTPVPDDEVEVDITLLSLTHIKRLELGPEDAEAALEQERASKKPRQSVIDYLTSVAGG
jgi:hypothetical protein